MQRIGITLVLFCTLSVNAQANDTETVTERVRLENVVNELGFIQAYLDQTQHARKHNVRSRFNYERVLRELETIKVGIQHYVDESLNEPKPSASNEPAITGAYSR